MNALVFLLAAMALPICADCFKCYSELFGKGKEYGAEGATAKSEKRGFLVEGVQVFLEDLP